MFVEVEDDLAVRIAAAATERGVAPEDLAAEILAEQFPPRRRPGFVSLGRSTSGRRASEAEEMLLQELTARRRYLPTTPYRTASLEDYVMAPRSLSVFCICTAWTRSIPAPSAAAAWTASCISSTVPPASRQVLVKASMQ